MEQYWGFKGHSSIDSSINKNLLFGLMRMRIWDAVIFQKMYIHAITGFKT